MHTLILNDIGCICENVFYLHLILYFWVFASSVGVLFNHFIYVLIVCFKFWTSRPTKIGFYTYFEYLKNNNCFKLYKITLFIRWHFCHYPGVRGIIIIVFQVWVRILLRTILSFQAIHGTNLQKIEMSRSNFVKIKSGMIFCKKVISQNFWCNYSIISFNRTIKSIASES